MTKEIKPLLHVKKDDLGPYMYQLEPSAKRWRKTASLRSTRRYVTLETACINSCVFCSCFSLRLIYTKMKSDLLPTRSTDH